MAAAEEAGTVGVETVEEEVGDSEPTLRRRREADPGHVRGRGNEIATATAGGTETEVAIALAVADHAAPAVQGLARDPGTAIAPADSAASRQVTTTRARARPGPPCRPWAPSCRPT